MEPLPSGNGRPLLLSLRDAQPRPSPLFLAVTLPSTETFQCVLQWWHPVWTGLEFELLVGSGLGTRTDWFGFDGTRSVRSIQVVRVFSGLRSGRRSFAEPG